MTRYERRRFFDRLIELRDAYARTEHQPTGLTVARAIEYGIELLDAAARDGGAAGAGVTATESPDAA